MRVTKQRRSSMRWRAAAAATAMTLAWNGCVRAHAPSVTSPSPTTTLRIAGVAPTPMPGSAPLLGDPRASHYRRIALGAGPCRYAQTWARIDGVTYIGCYDPGHIVAEAGGTILASQPVQMDGINSIERAGPTAVAILGYNDGATLRSAIEFLRHRTLSSIGKSAIEDSTFLGVVGSVAYIDDWCCNGRPDEYRPATIYTFSLKNGVTSPPLDLAPDSASHPASEQPLGQGARNYLIPPYFYVVVGAVTYRYNIRDLRQPPVRLATQ